MRTIFGILLAILVASSALLAQEENGKNKVENRYQDTKESKSENKSTPKGTDKKSITVRWCGQSYFQLKSAEGDLIVFDPHSMPEFGRQIVKGDMVCISHLHDDHSQYEVLENAASLEKELSKRVFFGLDPKTKGKKFNAIDAKYRSISIRTVPSYHDAEEGMKRGKNAIFVLEIDGLKVVHLGDLGHDLDDSAVKAIGPVDILFIPIGGIYTINGDTAKEILKKLKPKRYIFPMHYGIPSVMEDLQTADEFLDGQKNIKKIKANEFRIAIDEKVENPTIVMMGWQPDEGSTDKDK